VTSGTLHRAVASFVDALAHAGVRHVCACPGSRSTPLVIELARQPEVKLWMHLDERSAAYFGLGLARACRQPVALLATSGTAAANFFPAVVEANLARVPLVVLTADRPHELRDNGAPQSIDQLRLFGQHAKWFFDLPEPDASTDQLALLRALAARGVATALAEPSGPVQLNWPLREPLIPATDGGRDPGPQLSVHPGRLGPTEHTVAEVAAACSSARRGLIVVGPQDDAKLPSAVADL
jgi:2-succinyl-5-enolpyruvyl-6-hydroxy-3-cyclohexene-1-carboxylate synthase